MSWRELGYRAQGKRISQQDLKAVIKKLPSLSGLSRLISDDIFWDRIESIADAGYGEVFDRHVVGGPHNFVANGIVVHNSIEQDADVIMLLQRHRKSDGTDGMFVHIDKVRNDPTGTIELQFRGTTMELYEEIDMGPGMDAEP